MTPARSHFRLYKLKTGLKAIVKLAFKRNRKPPPPSPTTSAIFPDPPVQDAVCSTEKEYTFTVDLDPILWREILSYCEVIDIIHVGMTCRSMASAIEEHQVWYFALLRICHRKRLPHLHSRLKSLSYTTLRQKAILSTRLDCLSRISRLRSFPCATACISLRGVSTIWCMSFLPGGEWLLFLCRFERTTEERVMLCRTGDPLGRPCAHVTMSDGHWSGMRTFTSDQGDLLLLLRSDRRDTTKLCVYLIHPLDDCPRLEEVYTIDTPRIENCAALGNYLVVGWLDSSDGKPRHYVKISRFAPSYRTISEQCTMEVEMEVGKWPHSYGLRIRDSQITVVASSTSLIAAYTAPPLAPVSSRYDPVVVAPCWRFSCIHMSPRVVYLVPSLPAIDAPSVIILYGNRCLLLSPSFDADPPDLHPSYFSTFTYPRSLKRPILLGPHHAFWDLGGGRVGTRILPTPLLPAFHEHGSWNTPGIHTPEADLAHHVQQLIYAENHDRRVEKAAWDEESGRLALSPRPDYEQDENVAIFLVDLVSG